MHFEDGVTASDRELCLKYWAFTQPGTWTHKVADLGSTTKVLLTVKAACTATIPHFVCPQCSGPLTARSRSDLATWRVWHPDTFPRAEQTAKIPCDQCHESAARARQKAEQEEAERWRREKEEAKAKEQAATQARVEAASNWLADHRNRPEPGDLPEPAEALTLLTMIDIMVRRDVHTFGPLKDTDYLLSVSHSADLHALKALYKQRWIAPALPATIGDFVFRDDRTVEAVYVDQVPWQLAHALGDETPQSTPDLAEHLRLFLLDSPEELTTLVEDLDVTTAVTYLNDLLVTKYQEEPLPEHRLQDAHDYCRRALHSGLTFGQLLATAWSAAAAAVAWGQRTRGLRPGAVSSAAVTNLERRLGFARDRKVPEYDLPHWVTPPANRSTALRLLEQHQAESQALSRFRSLQQRIASRETDAWELDADLAEAEATGSGVPPDTDFERDLAKLLGTDSRPQDTRPLRYALVSPDGSLEFHTESADAMRTKVGLAGAGLVDRIVLPGPGLVHAYVAEVVPASQKTANPIADTMLQLMGSYDGPFHGPISFFSVRPDSLTPHSLDAEQQDLLRAAHEVAQARATPQGPVR
ncbi:hypothetical protein [Streptomyces cucumeris]|uniref:hypothetical protein n=1 Tax=Streptomyces cucumeris TaxID=2962890 RepID=UPI0020C8B199|nr:hypothetical protein [Streptomyces sp. NEAU-Y11]MCP9213287.1 hypothetical protein [Streptomyces sp. NEAU-Y11]